MTFVIEFMINL